MSSKRWPSGQPLTIAVTDMATGKAEARECPDGKSSGADCVGPTLRRLGSARRGRVGRCQGLFRRRFRRGGVTGGPGGVELGCVVPRRRDTLRVINGMLPPRANPPRLSYWSGAAPSVGADSSLVGGGTVSPSGDTSGSQPGGASGTTPVKRVPTGGDAVICTSASRSSRSVIWRLLPCGSPISSNILQPFVGDPILRARSPRQRRTCQGRPLA